MMYLEVLENKVVGVESIEGGITSSFYLLPQKQQMDIQQEVFKRTDDWVARENQSRDEENQLTQEECDEKMREFYTMKWEELNIHDVYCILVNEKPTYVYDDIEEGKKAFIQLRADLRDEVYVVMHSSIIQPRLVPAE